MKVRIENLHAMCENNTLGLTRARRYFELNGHIVADGEEQVDLAFIGACTVTDLMRARCEGIILETMERLPDARFVVFGCLAAFPRTLRAAAGQENHRLHFIDYRSSCELDKLIGARIPYEAVSATRLHDHVPYQPRIGPDDSYVLIAQGCVNHCSYCNIKKAKGHVLSRSEAAIEAEVRELHASGVRTVTLLADDCGSYGLDRDSDLPALLLRLSRATPDVRYKIYTAFPSLFLGYAERLEPFFAKRLIPYLCLPVQSAAARILTLMNRYYEPDRLAETIARLRRLDAEVFVYSHFIFNFPTETWEEFERSVAFARHFDHCVFIGYGENRGTRAAAIVPKNDDRERRARARHLDELVARGELAAFVVPST